ncbi:MAG: fused response regulator/phosphatase [Desulfobacterales bacterium]|nr:fused response regulator/phosphatase [Desulfobacterales bacterium]
MNKNPTILIIDDHPLNLKLLESALKKNGYCIITASNGPLSRKLARTDLPDLILLDIMMPGENGFEVIRHLKRDARTSFIPVIFLTARDDLEAKIKGFDLGAVDYISKPFHTKEVLARIGLHMKLSLATNSLVACQAEKLKQIKWAQNSLLITPCDLPKAHFGIDYTSLQEAGGDFYDVLQISDDIFGYFVGDIAGHDIATSYLTAALKALLRQNCIPIYEPIESMKIINDVLLQILPDEKYLTACYARLNRKKNIMTIVNGGHPPALYLPRNGKGVLMNIPGDILGIFKEVCLCSKDIKVNPGDRFFIFTDGLIEKSGKRKVWTASLSKLLRLCCELDKIPIQESVNKLKELVLDDTHMPEDDVIIMGIEV